MAKKQNRGKAKNPIIKFCKSYCKQYTLSSVLRICDIKRSEYETIRKSWEIRSNKKEDTRPQSCEKLGTLEDRTESMIKLIKIRIVRHCYNMIKGIEKD